MASAAVNELVSQEVGADEPLLWVGRPRQGLMLRGTDAFLIPFSLMWGGFAIFWEAMVIASGAPVFMVLWGVPFVLVGLYLIVGRFWVDARQRSRTVYAVTPERVIVISGLFSRQVKSLDLRTLSDVTLSERRDGSGTIMFGPVPPWGLWYSRQWPGLQQPMVPCFERIEDARGVYEIVREGQRRCRE